MKFTKLSLAAMIAMGVASSAFAVDNLKVDGQVKVWYQTTDVSTVTGEASTSDANNDGIFKKDGATGDLVAKLRATGNFNSKIGFGTTLYAVSTMGLENNLVSGEAIGQTTSDGRGAAGTALNGSDKMPMWLGEAYVTYKMGNTIAKIGRQELDTPLAFTETWNAAPNTFEAAVLVNNDLPQTTLVAAYVSRGNGYTNSWAPGLGVVAANGSLANEGTGLNRRTVANGSFYNYHSTFTANPLGNGNTALTTSGDKGGAYALGLVNKSIPGLTIHPVYYNVLDTAMAYWIDLTYAAPYGIKLEGLYANVDPVGNTQTILDAVKAIYANDSTDAYAFQISGELAGFKLAGAYSSVGKGFMPVANTATGFKKTKIYTASIFSDGEIAAKPDTTGAKLSVGYDIAGFKLGASYAWYDVNKNDGKLDWFQTSRAAEYKPTELDLSVMTKVDQVNLAAYYINQNEYVPVSTTAGTEFRDRNIVRVIASIDF